VEIPRADRKLERLQEPVFADALTATYDQGVVDLGAGLLHPLR
jgi:hypothetical protein